MNKILAQSTKPVLYDRVNFVLISKGILTAYLITLPSFVIFAVILTYTSFPEKFIPAAVTFTTVISILIAGSTATRNVKNRGWLNGGVVGAIYVVVLYIISSLIFRNFEVNSHVITILILGIFIGALGGIIGINLKKKIHYGTR